MWDAIFYIKKFYNKNILTSKYSYFFNIVNLSKSDKIILLVSPTIKSKTYIDIHLWENTYWCINFTENVRGHSN